MKYPHIEKLANKLFMEMGSVIPVNPIRIADKYGIPVYDNNLDDDIDGGILYKKNKVEIRVNKNTSINRQRFTIAHELGHYFLHISSGEEGGIVNYRRDLLSTQGKTPIEMEANAFASALLMDKETILKVYEEYRSIPYIAGMFGVSEEAVKYRLMNLGVIENEKC